MRDDTSVGSLAITGLNALRAEGVGSSGSYTAKLLNWSDEETAVSFPSLVDAIGWVANAMEDGTLAKRADIYSARGELVWSERTGLTAQRRQNAMKQNAERLLEETDDWQESPPLMPTTDGDEVSG
jgi:hypothetical protein